MASCRPPSRSSSAARVCVSDSRSFGLRLASGWPPLAACSLLALPLLLQRTRRDSPPQLGRRRRRRARSSLLSVRPSSRYRARPSSICSPNLTRMATSRWCACWARRSSGIRSSASTRRARSRTRSSAAWRPAPWPVTTDLDQTSHHLPPSVSPPGHTSHHPPPSVSPPGHTSHHPPPSVSRPTHLVRSHRAVGAKYDARALVALALLPAAHSGEAHCTEGAQEPSERTRRALWQRRRVARL
jgi:hypothetical protein